MTKLRSLDTSAKKRFKEAVGKGGVELDKLHARTAGRIMMFKNNGRTAPPITLDQLQETIRALDEESWEAYEKRVQKEIQEVLDKKGKV